MSSNFIKFAQAVGGDIKALNEAAAFIGNLQELSTTTKNTLVAAINEIASRQSGTGGLSGGEVDSKISAAISALKSEILGGSVSAELDTLYELATKLTQVINDPSIKQAVLDKFVEVNKEIKSIKDADLVTAYNNAKAGA